MALVKFKTLAVVWNGIFSRWADVGSILLWHASFSKDGARVSTVFFLHSTIFVDLLSEPRVTCRLDHRVTVTWSSTSTSLISGLCIWLFASFIRCPARSRQVRQKQHICCMIIPYHLLYPFFKTQPPSIWTERFLKKDYRRNISDFFCYSKQCLKNH